MKEYALTIVGWVLAGIFGILLFVKACEVPESELDAEIVEITNVVYDTIPGDSVPYEVIRHVPKPVPYPVEIEVPVMEWVDTASILWEFFQVQAYNDSIYSSDSAMLAIINDMVSQNRIMDRQVLFQDRTETVVAETTTFVESTKPKLYFGAELDYVGNTLGALRPEAEVIFLNRYAVSAGTNLLRPQPNFYAGLKFRIKFPKITKPKTEENVNGRTEN